MNRHDLPEVETGLVAEFPFTTRFSILLSIFKVYPALDRYLKVDRAYGWHAFTLLVLRRMEWSAKILGRVLRYAIRRNRRSCVISSSLATISSFPSFPVETEHPF